MSTDFPYRPAQHEIGDFGERFVAYHLPSPWVIHQYKGTEDYGCDLHVEVFSSGRATGLEFAIQVKASAGSIRRDSASVTLTKNNLSYLAAKPYPTMAVVVSQHDELGIYGWVQQILPAHEIMAAIQNSATTTLTIPLQPNHEIRNAEARIIEYLEERREKVRSWLATTSHTHLLVNIYLDIHAALDAVIECVSLIQRKDRTVDEESYKTTFTFTLTMMAYGCMYWITQAERIAVFGPLGPTMLALRSKYRAIIAEMVPEPYLSDYEKGGSDDIAIVPASRSKLLPSAPRLACVLRDILRTIGSFMSPSRDFSMRMSGLATDIIEYNSRKMKAADNR